MMSQPWHFPDNPPTRTYIGHGLKCISDNPNPRFYSSPIYEPRSVKDARYVTRWWYTRYMFVTPDLKSFIPNQTRDLEKSNSFQRRIISMAPSYTTNSAAKRQ